MTQILVAGGSGRLGRELIAAPAVAMIRALFDGAPQQVRAALQMRDDYAFAHKVALLRGRLSGW